MDSDADKIAKKIVSSRRSNVVDLVGWREGRKISLEAGFGGDGLPFGKFAGLDPCQALYVVGENVASLMSESISTMREAKGYVRIAGGAEDRYLPAGPPMSPLTVSYFSTWAMFDVRFGSSRETLTAAFCALLPSWIARVGWVDTVERMQQSRMGF